MAEAKEEINVGGPGTDAVQRGERGMGVVGFHLAKRSEVDLALGDGRADRLHGLDFRPRQPDPRQPLRPGAPHGVMMKGIEGGRQPAPDGARAGGRKLLGCHNRAQPAKAGVTPAQAWLPGMVEQFLQARVRGHELLQRGLQIGVGVEEVGHEPSANISNPLPLWERVVPSEARDRVRGSFQQSAV